MNARRTTCVLVALTLLALLAAPAAARTAGQVVDDTTIATKVKAKLVADKLSNLTRVTVKVMEGVVTLSGEVDEVAVRDRAVQLASGVDGVKSVVDNIRLSGRALAPSPSVVSSAPPVVSSAPASVTTAPTDVSGVVASVDSQAGTITLQDGRVIRLGQGAVVWQSVPVSSLRPGTQIEVRNALPVSVQSGTAPR